jgi:hypothetical protein
MALAPAMEGLLSVADLTNTNLHVIPLITAPCLYDVNDVTAPWAGHARFSHIKYYDAGTAPVTGKCTPKFPTRISQAQSLWPLVFQLSNQAAITHFGLASAAQYRGVPKITKITKITKKN